MRVFIDQGMCTGCGVCCEFAPDVFRVSAMDGLGYVVHAESGLATSEPVNVPDGQDLQVLRAVEECPSEAVMINTVMRLSPASATAQEQKSPAPSCTDPCCY